MTHEIAISIGVDIMAGMEFWIDKAEWEALDDAGKRTRVEVEINNLALQIGDNIQQYRGCTLSMQVMDPEPNTVDLKDIEIYDPKAQSC